jgi:hypothetical protein
MEFDPDKQFIEDTEVVVDIPKEKTNDSVIESTDLTKYGLVATVAKNDLVLLWEWKPLEEARIIAKDNFRRI